MVIRRDKIIFQTEEQQHQFNMPYQLGYESNDTPYAADIIDIRLHDGDIIILATDGVLDNVFPSEIAQIVKENFHQSSQEIAALISEAASRAGSSANTGITPWTQNTAKIGFHCPGGKEDDITVIVAKYLNE